MRNPSRPSAGCRRGAAAPVALLAVFACLAAALAAPVRLPAEQTPAPVTSPGFRLGNVFDLEWAADPRISPDGERVVFVRSGFDRMTDRPRHSLWIVGADGSGLRPLTDPELDTTSPRWSPDGARLAYVTHGEDHQAEIRVLYLGSGTTARLVSLEHPPSELAWSPDGTALAFALFVPAPPGPPLARMPAPPKGADWGPEIKVIDRLVYRFNGQGYLPRGRTHLFVLPAEGGAPLQVTEGDVDDNGSLVWTPDGKALVFSANRHEDAPYRPLDTEVYEVPAAGGAVRALTRRDGPDRNPAVSPAGRWIAYTGFDDRHQGYQVTRLYLMRRDGSGARLVTAALDRDVEDPRWDADGQGLTIQYDDEGTTRIGHVDLEGRVQVLASDVGGLDLGRPYSGGEYTRSPGSGRFAFTLTGPDHPADVAVGSVGGGEPRRLTDLSRGLLGHLELGALEEIHFPSSYDRRPIEGWVLRPPGFDPAAKYPLLLEIHGGPFANYGPRFSAEDQLYAAAGYVVLYVNPRGSTSYGEAFGNLIHHDYPDHDFDDLMSGVDAVVARGFVDPGRLYVTGGSGGGVLTAWIVGHTDRFRAAAVAKPVINWYSWVLTSDLPSFGVTYWFGGYPWENLESYMKRSPISYAGQVTTPSLVMTGEEDYRTPSSDAEQFYEALKLRKVPSVMVRIPDANHEIAEKPSNMMAKVAYILGWFERYGGEKPPAP